MHVYQYLLDRIEKNGAVYLILIDPDKTNGENLRRFVLECSTAGVDGFLFGGSLLMSSTTDRQIEIIKQNADLPVILFPGSVNQITTSVDAILFLSLISGRNADYLIGKHVLAAPIIKHHNIETISTGYIMVESGKLTTAGYMSDSFPVPRHKPEIAVATALAGQYLGMKMIYLEAGSGADEHVPTGLVRKVVEACDIPVIVGGGIRTPETASEIVRAGAKVIVTGNHFEREETWNRVRDFSRAVHYKSN